MKEKTTKVVRWILGVLLLLLTFAFLPEKAYISAFTTGILGIIFLLPIQTLIEFGIGRKLTVAYLITVFFFAVIFSIAIAPQHLKDKWNAQQKQAEGGKNHNKDEIEGKEVETENDLSNDKVKKKNNQAQTNGETVKNYEKDGNMADKPKTETNNRRFRVVQKMSIVERQDAFRRLRICEKTSLEQANNKFGKWNDEWNKDKKEEYSNFRSQVLDACVKGILSDYNIDRWLLGEIEAEALSEQWTE
jgi:hypothetical protein